MPRHRRVVIAEAFGKTQEAPRGTCDRSTKITHKQLPFSTAPPKRRSRASESLENLNDAARCLVSFTCLKGRAAVLVCARIYSAGAARPAAASLLALLARRREAGEQGVARAAAASAHRVVLTLVQRCAGPSKPPDRGATPSPLSRRQRVVRSAPQLYASSSLASVLQAASPRGIQPQPFFSGLQSPT